MSDQPEHLDPKEATEAKLCAYLEGELPPNERAEIELHLNANPQHRKLLADLAQTRDWMRSIPRESAPSDLAESFQGQVERNMLLNESGDTGSGMAIGRWPQIAMIAAIMVLTLGLGVTLVIMLKGPSQPRNVAAMSSSPVPTTAPVVALKSTDESRTPIVVAALPPASVSTPAPAAVVAPPSVTLADAMSADRTIAGAHGLADKDTNVDEIKTKLASSGYRVPGDAKTICFVVRSDIPATTIDQVHLFFTRHQLLLEEPASITPNRSQSVVAYGANSETKGGRAGGQDGDQTNAAQQMKQDATLNNGTTNAATPVAPGQNQAVAAGGGGSASGIAANGANGTNNNSQAANSNVQTANSVQGATTVASGTLTTQNALQAPGAVVGDQLYVGHGLTPLQLELLSASLATDNQTVKRMTLSEGTIFAREKEAVAAPGTITKGQTLTVTIPQLVGPGIEKSNVVKVAEDGTISLPMIDPVPAAGSTADDLKQKIVAKYRDANLIADASVTVAAGPSTQPTTMPTTQLMAAVKAMQTTQPTDAPAAATQPAHDPGIDVVVVIEKSK